MRTDGTPSGVAVATTTALGSGSRAAMASFIHRWNISNGSAARSVSVSPPRAYSSRSADQSCRSPPPVPMPAP